MFVCRNDFRLEFWLIAYIHIWFRLDGELLFFQQRKKSNQKNAAPTSLPLWGPLSICLCQRAALTRRPGSTRLNPTSVSDFPYQRQILRQTSGGQTLSSILAWMLYSEAPASFKLRRTPGFRCTSSSLKPHRSRTGRQTLWGECSSRQARRRQLHW